MVHRLFTRGPSHTLWRIEQQPRHGDILPSFDPEPNPIQSEALLKRKSRGHEGDHLLECPSENLVTTANFTNPNVDGKEEARPFGIEMEGVLGVARGETHLIGISPLHRSNPPYATQDFTSPQNLSA